MDTNTGFLMADAAHPLICSGPLWEEMLLYNIPSERQAELCAAFERISSKTLSSNSLISELSGGQKVILMACLAVFSPARRICFIDLEHSLDPLRYQAVTALIESSGKEISFRGPR